jgi:RNA-splicing ligase RtcB
MKLFLFCREILKTFETTCQGSGRYIEAEMAKNRIKDLKKDLDKKKREEVKSQHDEEV